ncbi:MAG TPA: hypothetical protein VMT67_09620 [Terriglobales bacterium]|nr:hypothetical protein [Terriglobales bacterium]
MINRPTNLCTSEATLTRLAQEGHIAAFSTLFDLHKATIYSLCLRSTETPAEAEQMLHSIFGDAFRAIAVPGDSGAFSELLYRAADIRIQMYERQHHLAGPYLDHLVQLAAEPIAATRSGSRIGGMIARWRGARARLSGQHA